jgi:hypothetical protein
MNTATAHLKSLSPYSQSAYLQTPKLEKETAKDYEARVWRDRCHALPDGRIFIPPMAFKNCLSEAAKYLGVQIPGKGKSTYTKHFEAGVLVTDALVLPDMKDTVAGEWLLMNSDGIPGSGKRVERCYPKIESWEGNIIFHVLDPQITESVFRQHLEEAGRFIGIGRFRPRNRGYYGRFEVVNLSWEE